MKIKYLNNKDCPFCLKIQSFREICDIFKTKRIIFKCCFDYTKSPEIYSKNNFV